MQSDEIQFLGKNKLCLKEFKKKNGEYIRMNRKTY